MVTLIKNILFNPVIIFTFIFLAALFLISIKFFNINVKQEITKVTGKIIINRLRKDREMSKRMEQLEKLGIHQKGWRKTYRNLIQNIIISMKLSGIVTVENFTTLFSLIGLTLFIIYSIFFDSILIGLGVTIPSVSAVVAFLVSLTKSSVRANDNRVMDSLDLICPTIDHSVTAAIKKNLHAFDIKIRHHYIDFLNDINYRGLLFPEAIKELNKKLGPRFDEFASRAIIFHDVGEEGMADMFMDVVEINNSIRRINSKADMIFKRINNNTLGSFVIILLFLVFMYINPMTGDFMKYTFFGKLVTAICISIIIIMYTVIQVVQANIDYKKIDE